MASLPEDLTRVTGQRDLSVIETFRRQNHLGEFTRPF